MKKFTYQYSDIQHDILTNSDRTNLKRLSGGLEIFVPPDDLLEDAIVPEITYTATNATSVDKTVKAWTYYCDSLSGCVEGTAHYEDGDGSAENPWRSLDYALKQIQNIITCWRTNLCCYDPFRKGKYFQMKVNGVLDYKILSLSHEFRGAELVNGEWVQQFIISPWDIENIEVKKLCRFTHVYGTIFNHMKVIGLEITGSGGNPIYGCGDSLFNHTIVEVETNAHYNCFYSCHGARFCDLNVNSEIYDSYTDSYAILENCQGSDIIGGTIINQPLLGEFTGNLYNVTVFIRDNTERFYKKFSGVRNFTGCGFFNCSADVGGILNCDSGYGYLDAAGFYGNSNCTFYNCISNGSCQKCSGSPGYTCQTPDF